MLYEPPVQGCGAALLCANYQDIGKWVRPLTDKECGASESSVEFESQLTRSGVERLDPVQ